MESNNIYKFSSRKKWGSVAVCVACFEFFKFLFIVLSYVYYETKHSIETGVIIYCLLLVHFEQKQFLLFNQTIFPYFLPTENAALFYVSLLWTETLDAVVDFYIIGIGIKHLEVWQFVSSSSVNCFGKIVFLIVELLVLYGHFEEEKNTSRRLTLFNYWLFDNFEFHKNIFYHDDEARNIFKSARITILIRTSCFSCSRLYSNVAHEYKPKRKKILKIRSWRFSFLHLKLFLTSIGVHNQNPNQNRRP